MGGAGGGRAAAAAAAAAARAERRCAGVVDVASMGAVQFDGERPAEAAAAREELARLLRLYFRETVTFLRSTSKTTKSVSNYWLAEDVIEDVVNTAIGTDGSLVLNASEATPAEEARLRGLARPPVLVPPG